ncbi:MAG: translocation/assembly module TamB domain-containing protein [Polyangiaceae bacterium]|jgi:translocation and assembly module TamB
MTTRPADDFQTRDRRRAGKKIRRPRPAWDRAPARFLCFILALIGVLPFAGVRVAESAWARSWAAREAQRALLEQGITATFAPSIRIWPLSIELDRVRVESSDGGAPAVLASRVFIRPKLFALLAGKLAIGQIDIDQPHVRFVVRNGRLLNLTLPRSNGAGGPVHAPFETFSVTDASVDGEVDGARIEAQSLDLDASAEDDDRRLGSSFEVAIRVGQAAVHRPRPGRDGSTAFDDDSLCKVEGRVRVEPRSVLIRRFEAVGTADLDAASGATPPCDVGLSDKRRVEISLGHVRVKLENDGASMPTVDGHIRVRAPIGLVERAAALPETDGWVGADVDVRYGVDTILPDLSGRLEAHDVRLGQYAFAEELHSAFSVHRNVLESPQTTIRLAGGLVTLSDTVIDPLAQGARLEHTRLDAANVDFTALLRALGVHPHSWVGWDIREIHVPGLSGTFAPLKLDGELSARTYSFGIYDRPAEDRARERLFGFSEAQIGGHVAVRRDALKFMDLRATLPNSHIDGGFVSLGFDDVLRVDVPHFHANLDDISPLGTVPLHGAIDASAKVGGVFNRPTPEGDIQSASNLVVADVTFGDIASGHVKVDVKKPEVELSGIRARRRSSAYEIPSARLAFGGDRGFTVDAVGSSEALGLRDLLSMFGLDEDPRFDGLDAAIGMRAGVHVAAGGPEDACGNGYIAVDATTQLRKVGLFGESFARGSADLSLRWYDRRRGIAGAELDVRSFVLDKVEPPSENRTGAAGTVLGSATLRRGGALAANVSIGGVPLGRIDAFGRFAKSVEGNLTGVAQISGNLDDFTEDAGFVVKASLDASGTRLRNIALAGSHLDVQMTERMPMQTRSYGRTQCGAPIGPPFDPQSYRQDTSVHGDWTVNGSLLGGTVGLDQIVLTRGRAPQLTGRVSLRGVDMGPLGRMTSSSGGDDRTTDHGPAIGGQLWGELFLDDVRLADLSHSRARLLLGPTVISRADQRLTLQPPSDPLVIADDALTIPPLHVTLSAADGFRGGFELTGGATQLTRNADLSFAAHLEPVDLEILQRIAPKVERAAGRAEGTLTITGKASSPVIAGELHVTGDDLEIRGLPSAVTAVVIDVKANAREITAAGTGMFAAGTIAFHASAPIRGLDLGACESRVTVRGVRLTPEEGVSTALDADLDVTYDPKAPRGTTAALPHVVGEVTIDALSYTRPITFNLDLASKAKRTEVATYDPALDFLVIDVRIVSRAPIDIKDNLIEVQLGVDSGTLEVTGTNQRLGLRGVLRARPGGHFHFQSHDFEIQQGVIRFEDPTRIDPNVDITAVTEYRRYADTSAGAAAGTGTAAGTGAASAVSTRGGSLWRITMHAYGDADSVRIELTSEPALAQDDIVLLLYMGMTRAELDQLQATGIGESVALNVVGAATGADRAVKQAIPLIDDFRFGSAYSTVTGKTEPQLTVGKRLTNNLRASVTAGLSEDSEVRSDIEWRLNNHLSLQGSYDNINDVSSSALGNIGVDLRWRLDFE